MKIREIDFYPSAEVEEYTINGFIAGTMLDPYTLNKIMKYLHFDDEEVICTGKRCPECPFFNKNVVGECISSYNNHVRNLIKGEMRVNLEDIL